MVVAHRRRWLAPRQGAACGENCCRSSAGTVSAGVGKGKAPLQAGRAQDAHRCCSCCGMLEMCSWSSPGTD